MPFNGSGVFTPLTPDNPVVANTLIQATKFNNTMNDIATGLSTALTKDGQTTVTANISGAGFYLTTWGLRAIAGTVGTPGISFIDDTDCGLYRIGANNLGLALNGAKVVDFLTTGLTLTGNAIVSGTLAIGTSGLTVTGSSVGWGFAVTPSTWSTGKAVEVGTVGSGVWSGFSATWLVNNYYYDAAEKFAGTGFAAAYNQTAGAHNWYTSTASGTAGNAATMTKTMSIDNGGRFNVGAAIASIGGLPATHGMTSNTSTEFSLGIKNSSAGPYGIAVQYSAADPNGTGNVWLYFIGSGGVQRLEGRSNGGIANYSANDVNLSDERTKDVFEDYSDEMLDELETKWTAIRRGRFKYNDQTHGDWNYGKSAQSVKEHLPELAGVWNETKILVEDDKERRVPTPEAEQLLCEYPYDLSQIGEALLVRALKRIKALEQQVATLQ